MRVVVAVTTLLISAGAGVAGQRDWSGTYIGGSLGYGSARVKADFGLPNGALFGTDDRLSGGLFGGQLGYNLQFGKFVFGIEADAAASTQKTNSTHVCAAPACGAAAVTFANRQDITWVGTLRGRAGVAMDRWLLYATGGVGGGGFESKHSVSATLTTVTSVSTESGPAWVVGGGIEMAIDPKWSVKFEYLYLMLPETNSSYTLAGVGLIKETDQLTQHIIRTGLNYRF